MTFPCELTLRTTSDGIRMLARPVREIELLHRKKHELVGSRISAGQPASLPVQGDLLDVRAEFAVGDAQCCGLEVGGRKIGYDAATNKLEGMPLAPVDGRIRMQLLIDRPSIEVSGSDGRVCLTSPFRSQGSIESISAFADGGEATLVSLRAFELSSIWPR